MKTETLHTILTAKVLFERAESLCCANDRYVASAGLVLLQDCLELFMYAILLEKELDRKRSIENLAFPDLIGQVKSAGLKTPKSGTLKALNHQRLTVKHYGQLVEPTAVRNFFDASRIFIDSLLSEALGRRLEELLLVDIIPDGQARSHLKAASKLFDDTKYEECLVEIRKALFLEIEIEYAVDPWDRSDAQRHPLAHALLGGSRGLKAPWYTKRPEWIHENVLNPFVYVQFDRDHLRMDLIEWGVSTQDFWSLLRLTPAVFQFDGSNDWLIRDHSYGTARPREIAENCRFCLERAVSILAAKHAHSQLARRQPGRPTKRPSFTVGSRAPVYKRACSESAVVAHLEPGVLYNWSERLEGFDRKQYISVLELRMPAHPLEGGVLSGYVWEELCEMKSETQGD